MSMHWALADQFFPFLIFLLEVISLKKESMFQAGLIREISEMIPGCIITKNDPDYIQGIPDLSISFGLRTAWLECKRSENEHHQPNQDYYVNLINSQGGFARFIYPENKAEVLNELQRSFGT